MKRLVVALGFAAVALGFIGCANEGPTAEELGERLRKGVRGEGRLGEIDRSNDPYVRPREGAPPEVE